MEILFLGNGGALNDGLPYNSFVLNGRYLVETPPDLMPSLAREGIPPDSIEEIFISHSHGDHTFGFPFFVLERLRLSGGKPLKKPIRVIMPGEAKETLTALMIHAFSEDHPVIRWAETALEWVDPLSPEGFEFAGFRGKGYSMNHLVPTSGFLLSRGEWTCLAYSADTLWCDSLAEMTAEKPDCFVIDLNGENNDRVQVHLSEKELRSLLFPIASKTTLFAGTHLKTQKTGTDRRLVYARPGLRLIVPE